MVVHSPITHASDSQHPTNRSPPAESSTSQSHAPKQPPQRHPSQSSPCLQPPTAGSADNEEKTVTALFAQAEQSEATHEFTPPDADEERREIQVHKEKQPPPLAKLQSEAFGGRSPNARESGDRIERATEETNDAGNTERNPDKSMTMAEGILRALVPGNTGSPDDTFTTESNRHKDAADVSSKTPTQTSSDSNTGSDRPRPHRSPSLGAAGPDCLPAEAEESKVFPKLPSQDPVVPGMTPEHRHLSTQVHSRDSSRCKRRQNKSSGKAPTVG